MPGSAATLPRASLRHRGVASSAMQGWVARTRHTSQDDSYAKCPPVPDDSRPAQAPGILPAHTLLRRILLQRKGRWDEFKLWSLGYKQVRPQGDAQTCRRTLCHTARAGLNSLASASTTPKRPAGAGRAHRCLVRTARSAQRTLAYTPLRARSAQEFPRTFTFFNCFACGLSIMSAFTLVTSYSAQGLVYGGPVVVIWG